MKILIASLTAALSLAACQKSDSDSAVTATKTAEVTPFDQSNSEGDLKISQAIRQAVVARDDFSMNAKNVKIITADGVVTLRGPVATKAEADAILAMAKDAGARSIQNQLELQER